MVDNLVVEQFEKYVERNCLQLEKENYTAGRTYRSFVTEAAWKAWLESRIILVKELAEKKYKREKAKLS